VQDGIWEEARPHAWPRRRRFLERVPEPGLQDLAMLEGARAPVTAPRTPPC